LPSACIGIQFWPRFAWCCSSAAQVTTTLQLIVRVRC
jgi:hypothetical protein